ncbi:hypothetical protein PanNE5_03300 [Pandoraea sp. NE5]|uniref:hypothetical protein n=1 Tax=Pandoraea sp. NE5 TaxID=2904129 RepID=UPI0021C2A337|nr:hypothetical protein [Pandoraea sp. NE5]BDD90890.1 hypothetical protein PanNE5_03300 [Pandoraea sp. NE5]
MTRPKTITVAELRKMLEGLPNTSEIYLGNGDLSISRLKNRQYSDDLKTTPTLIQLEIAELYTVDQASESDR